jgi:hypothetical protein
MSDQRDDSHGCVEVSPSTLTLPVQISEKLIATRGSTAYKKLQTTS